MLYTEIAMQVLQAQPSIRHEVHFFIPEKPTLAPSVRAVELSRYLRKLCYLVVNTKIR